MSGSLRVLLGDRFDVLVTDVACPECSGAGEVADVRGTAVGRVDPEVRSSRGCPVSALVAPAGSTSTLLTEDTELDAGQYAHVVKVGPGEKAADLVLDARINGTPIEALCGHVWVPSRDPKALPVCPRCREVYELYRAFGDGGLNDTPGDA